MHAYIHRKEGDLDNARHWYRHASVAPSMETLAREWEEFVRELLAEV